MKRALWTVLALAFVHQVAQYASRPLISLLASDLGASSVQIGLIAGAFSTVQLVLALAAGQLADRAGSRTAALWGSLALVVGLGFLPFAGNWTLVLVLQVFAGLAHLYVQVGYQSLVTGMASGAQRENNVGLLTFIVSAGQSVGPIVGGWIDGAAGHRTSLTVSAALAVLGLALALVLPRNAGAGSGRGSKPVAAGSIWELLRTPTVSSAIYVGVAVLFATDVLTTYFPLYGQEIGLTPVAIGLALSVRSAASMVVRPIMGYIIRLVGRVAVVVSSLSLGGISIALYGLSTQVPVVMVVSAVAGLALGLAQPLTMVMVTDAAREEQRGQALALRLMGNRFGQAVSPILFGILATGLGLAPVFWISGGVLALSAYFGLPPKLRPAA
jgi:MFS family permease